MPSANNKPLKKEQIYFQMQ